MMEGSNFQPLPTLPWWEILIPRPYLLYHDGSFLFLALPTLTWWKVLIPRPCLLYHDGRFLFLAPAYSNIMEDSSFWALPTSPCWKFFITRPCLVYHDGSDLFPDPTYPTIMEVFYSEALPYQFLPRFMKWHSWTKAVCMTASPPSYLQPLFLTWISNYMLGKVWDEITYPFLNFNGCTVEV